MNVYKRGTFSIFITFHYHTSLQQYLILTSMKVQVTMIVISLFGLLSALGYSQESIGRERYCGRRLASTLAMLCQNTVEAVLVKRSWVRVDWPWLMPHRGTKLGRSKRQVVTECCDSRCNVNELLYYCWLKEWWLLKINCQLFIKLFKF